MPSLGAIRDNDVEISLQFNENLRLHIYPQNNKRNSHESSNIYHLELRLTY